MINFLILLGVIKAADQAERVADSLDDRTQYERINDTQTAWFLFASAALWPLCAAARLGVAYGIKYSLIPIAVFVPTYLFSWYAVYFILAVGWGFVEVGRLSYLHDRAYEEYEVDLHNS